MPRPVAPSGGEYPDSRWLTTSDGDLLGPLDGSNAGAPQERLFGPMASLPVKWRNPMYDFSASDGLTPDRSGAA